MLVLLGILHLAGVIFLAGILFLANVLMLVFMIKEFMSMKTAAILMENAFKEHQAMINNVQEFMTNGLENAEKQYHTVQNNYSEVINSNNALQERINQMEAKQKKPMAPDVTFN